MICLPTYGAAPRRASRAVRIGTVVIGGGAPIVVQSMTNTDTADLAATVEQVAQLARAGSEIVRVTVNNAEAAAQVPHLRERLDRMGVNVPLVGDFHFNGHRLLTQHPACAQALAKLRINPGNVGRGAKREDQFATMIEFACRYGKPVRIGVNWGSLDPELLARMMDENARLAEPAAAAVVTRKALVASALDSACQAEGLSTVNSRRAAITPCTWVSPRPVWDPRASSLRRRRWRCCCRKASATPYGFR